MAHANILTCLRALAGDAVQYSLRDREPRDFSKFSVVTSKGTMFLPPALTASEDGLALAAFFEDSRHNLFLEDFPLTELLASHWGHPLKDPNRREAWFSFGPTRKFLASQVGCIQLYVRVNDSWRGSIFEIHVYARDTYQIAGKKAVAFRRREQMAGYIPSYSDGKFIYKVSPIQAYLDKSFNRKIIFDPILKTFNSHPALRATRVVPVGFMPNDSGHPEAVTSLSATIRVNLREVEKGQAALGFLRDLYRELQVLGQSLDEMVEDEIQPAPLFVPARAGKPEISEGTYSLSLY